MHLAGQRRDAVPRRKRHELGGRLACSVRDAVAWRHQAQRGDQRDRVSHGLPPDLRGRSRGSGHRRQTQEDTISAAQTFKVHLDGYNLLPFLSGKELCPRDGFIYWSDDGDLMALRVQQYKIVFAEQLATGLQRLARAAEADAHPQDVRSAIGSIRAGEDSISTTTRSSSTSRFSTRRRRSCTSGSRASKSSRLGRRRRAPPSTRSSRGFRVFRGFRRAAR